MTPLEPAEVIRIFSACAGPGVEVEGIMARASFAADQLRRHEAEIRDLLDQLPDSFRLDGGGGMSFLNACHDRDGQMWTGEHRVMEMLFMLGLATGEAKCLFPRELWEALPGGMPYYAITERVS